MMIYVPGSNLYLPLTSLELMYDGDLAHTTLLWKNSVSNGIWVTVVIVESRKEYLYEEGFPSSTFKWYMTNPTKQWDTMTLT